jgi:hypothetical protein
LQLIRYIIESEDPEQALTHFEDFHNKWEAAWKETMRPEVQKTFESIVKMFVGQAMIYAVLNGAKMGDGS